MANIFKGTAISQGEYKMQSVVFESNKISAELAKKFMAHNKKKKKKKKKEERKKIDGSGFSAHRFAADKQFRSTMNRSSSQQTSSFVMTPPWRSNALSPWRRRTSMSSRRISRRLPLMQRL